MKHSDLVRTAARLFEAREPFMVIGPPGGGKTEGLVQAAKSALKARGKVIITHPVISEEVDYRGLPGFVQQDGQLRAVFMPFGFLREIVETKEPTIVIIDDVGQARLSVQAALMQMVQLREIDGAKVSDTVTFALASNRREDRAAVQGMVTALLDRCVCVLKLEVDADELGRWLISNEYPTILAAFVRFRPGSITFDAKNEFEKSATPRSIAGLGRLLNLGMDTPEICSGAVGAAFASEFLAYRKVESALIPIEQILKDPEGVKIPKERDVLYAVMAGLAGKLDKQNLAQGIKYLDRVPPEFAVMVMKDVVAKVPEIHTVPAFVKWSRANAKLLGV